ncbi:MAG: transcription termination/antitermination factor NusG [Bacteroidetes bacterium]|jgi:transcriptional antiterminator NusG|nr:transcription termination/antitermination factor NusG [Bacteroidota bacterium]
MSEEDRKWYVLRVISGKERKLKEYIDMEITRSGWDKTITQVLVPTEKVYKIKNGKRVIQERNFYPGYIMIEAIPAGLSGEMISTIKNLTGVIHFLGKETPIPLRKSEVNRILGKVDEMQEEGTSMNEPFIVGETVKIIDGPFNEFLGNIEEIHEEKKKLKVNVKIFGRKTPVELNFMQVEKQH